MYRLLSIILTGLLVSNVAIAADPDAGESKSQACQACHGQDVKRLRLAHTDLDKN